MIRRIKIKNFRSLDVDLELDPVTVLIGRSGTGKTNFVEALRFLKNVIQNGVDQNILSPGLDLYKRVFPLNKAGDNIVEFEIEFDIYQSKDIFQYNISITSSLIISGHRAGGGINGEQFIINDETVFHRQGNSFIENSFSSGSELKSLKTYFSELSGNQKVSIARIALTHGLACFDFPGTVCCDKGIGPPNSLLDNASNFYGVFNSIRDDLTQLESWNRINRLLRNLNSTVETVDTDTKDQNKIIIAHKFGENIYPFDLSMESEGFRRFFVHLLALYQTPPKQTLVFEEPERGIHPGALQSLAEELKRCPEEKRGQVILTTHNPQLLDYFEPESIRAVEMVDGKTRIGRIANDQLESIREKLLFPGELLTVTEPILKEE